VGNPLIMMRMATQVADGCPYAPMSILVDERGDGVHLSYGRMAIFLSPYGNQAALAGNQAALAVARDLDAKVESLPQAAAG
jgi:hypothetical protein